MEKCVFWNSRLKSCSAIKKDGECSFCDCVFYKTKAQLAESRKKSRERLLSIGWKPEWIDDYEKYVNSSSERKEKEKC